MAALRQCQEPSRTPAAQGGRKKGQLTIQCDEMGSFVHHKGNKQWVCLALDVRTRENDIKRLAKKVAKLATLSASTAL